MTHLFEVDQVWVLQLLHNFYLKQNQVYTDVNKNQCQLLLPTLMIFFWPNRIREIYQQYDKYIHGCNFFFVKISVNSWCQLSQFRVADVEGAWERRSPKGQGLLRKEGPPTYDILSRNFLLLRFTRFLKGFRRALNESHPAFVEHSTTAILLS